MGYSIAYNSGSTVPFGTYKQGNILMGLKPQEYTTVSGFTWYANAETPNNNYLIISDTYSQGWSTQQESKPTIWRSETGTTESFVSLVNQLPDVNGVTGFTDSGSAMKYLMDSGKYFVNKDDYLGVVSNGLVLNLDAGWYPSYSGSGTTWYDLSGNNRHYTLKNGTSWSNGSFILDGVDDFIEGPPSNSFDIVQDHTIELVVKTTQIKQSVTFFWRSDNNRAILTHTPWVDGRIYYDIGGCCGGSQRIDYSNPNTLNNLMYYTYRTRSDVKPYRHIYENGVAKVNSGNNENSTITFNSSPMIIGGDGSSSSYKGHIYMLRVYNRALSDSEILQNYNAQKGRFGL